jgi:hypothetical protein
MKMVRRGKPGNPNFSGQGNCRDCSQDSTPINMVRFMDNDKNVIVGVIIFSRQQN